MFRKVRRSLLFGPPTSENHPRYHHHLSPDVVKDPWTAEEDMALAYAQNKIGNQWKQM